MKNKCIKIARKAVPGFDGVENEPKPWDATLPAPVLKVPVGFCSPKEDCPKLKVLAPLLPKRLLVPRRRTGKCNYTTIK